MKHGFISSLMALCLATPAFLHAGEPGHFCTMDQAVDRMINAAGINIEGMAKDLGGATTKERLTAEVRETAAAIVEKKLAKSRGGTVKIEWKDVYDLRGTVSARACNEGFRLYCVSSFNDAIGSGLTGTFLGKSLTYVTLSFAGPPGFVIMSGMGITQETFQCTPDTLAMALDAGATGVILLPWCSVPGINGLCVREAVLAKKTVLTVVNRNHGRDAAIALAKVIGSQSGSTVVRVVIEHLAFHGKEETTNAVKNHIHSDIVSHEAHEAREDRVPEPAAPQLIPSH